MYYFICIFPYFFLFPGVFLWYCRKKKLSFKSLPPKAHLPALVRLQIGAFALYYFILYATDLDNRIEIGLRAGDSLALVPVLFQNILAFLCVLGWLTLINRILGTDDLVGYLSKRKMAVSVEKTKNIGAKEQKFHWFLTFAPLLVTASYYPLFMFFRNADQVSPGEVVPSLLLFNGLGLGLCLCFGWITKDFLAASSVTLIFLLTIENFALIFSVVGTVFPWVYYWHLVSLLVVLFLGCYCLAPLYLRLGEKKIGLLLATSTFSSLILLNAITGIPLFLSKDQPLALQQVTATGGTTASDLPNVYYLIYDEYADVDTLKKYSGFDNEDFYTFLTEQGFYISRGCSNGVKNFSTHSVVPRYMNISLETAPSLPTEEAPYSYEWVNLMYQQGYQIKGVGDSAFVGIPSLTQDDGQNASTAEGYTFHQLLMQQSVFYPFYTVNSDQVQREKVKILRAFQYFSQPENYQDDTPTFTVQYLCIPHAPFYFNALGEDTNPFFLYDPTSLEHYLGQYQFVTDKIQENVTSILTYDPDCVIILQSDHSNRDLPGITPYDKTKVLNTVYYRGEVFSEMEEETGLNTLRLVVNRLFDSNLSMLEEPYNEYFD